jgi:hypothetical protein
MPKKFILTQGCTAGNFTVDGTPVNDLSHDEQVELIAYLLKSVVESHDGNEFHLIQKLVELHEYDSYEHDEHSCDQCGDTVNWTTWEI